jgi:hypothetical protein
MATARVFCPARLFVAAAGDFEAVLPRLRERFGAVRLMSEPYDLAAYTDYYVPELGRPQPKRIFGFDRMIDPAEIADIKRWTNEQESSPRRVNLDPGYLTPAKVVLASCKDFSHRVAVRDGVFAEVTLVYRKETGSYEPLEHTFPDYRSTGVIYFFNRFRELG